MKIGLAGVAIATSVAMFAFSDATLAAGMLTLDVYSVDFGTVEVGDKLPSIDVGAHFTADDPSAMSYFDYAYPTTPLA